MDKLDVEKILEMLISIQDEGIDTCRSELKKMNFGVAMNLLNDTYSEMRLLISSLQTFIEAHKK